MPIFVSRFSGDRVAGFVQSIRANAAGRLAEAEEDREGVRALQRRFRASQATEGENRRAELPTVSQAAEQLRDRLLRAIQGGGEEEDQAFAPVQTFADASERPDPHEQPSLPAVRSVDEERSVAEPELAAAEDPPIRRSRQTTVSQGVGVALQTATLNIQASTTDTSTPVQDDTASPREALQALAREIPSFETLQARGLNEALDAAIRFAAAQNQAAAAELAAPSEETTEEAAASAPTAVEISRENTTELIRADIQADTSQIEQSLTADARAQTSQTVRQTAQAAAQGAKESHDRALDVNARQERKLRTETRQLEQSLRAAERELRSVQHEGRQLTNADAGATAAASATVASQVML